MDFMTDVLDTGQKFRTFNVIDDYNRECLLIEPSYTLPSTRVTQLLDHIASSRGYPEMIRVDNGPEFTSREFKQWAKKNHILICYIQPGKPAQNGFIERFNRIFREDILDMNLFGNLSEVRDLIKKWIPLYNHERPHESLAGLSPSRFEEYRLKTVGNKLENSLFN
ncbi:MAG: transposase family protein [Legionellales bacterium]|nr:transposase family protein [Legionellales bacterium]